MKEKKIEVDSSFLMKVLHEQKSQGERLKGLENVYTHRLDTGLNLTAQLRQHSNINLQAFQVELITSMKKYGVEYLDLYYDAR